MSPRVLYSGIKRIFIRSHAIHPRYAQYATQNTHPSELPPWSPIAILMKDVEARCGYPIFSSVKRLAGSKSHLRPSILNPTLGAEREPFMESDWMFVAEATDFADSKSRLEAAGVRVARKSLELLSSKEYLRNPPPNDSFSQQPPTWLVMHILCNQVRTYHDMLFVLKLVYYHIPAAMPEIQSSLLVMTGIQLAQLGMVSPFRRLISCFLHLSFRVTADDFNLMIRAIALLPGSGEIGALSTGLVRLAISRKFLLTERTYDALLGPGIGNRGLVRAVEDAARIQKYTLTRHQLQSILHLQTKRPGSERAPQYLSRIRKAMQEDKADTVPYPPRPPLSGTLTGSGVTDDNRTYVQTFTSKRGAQGYLRRITRRAKYTTSKQRNAKYRHLPRFFHRNTVLQTVRDWAAILLVAARSPRVSRGSLIRLWRRGPRLYYDQLTTRHYNIAVNGLLKRWTIPQAVQLWEECRNRGLPLTSHAIGLGVTAYTLHHRPHRAFGFLEQVWEIRHKHYATPEDIERADLLEGAPSRRMIKEAAADVHDDDDQIAFAPTGDEDESPLTPGEVDPADVVVIAPEITSTELAEIAVDVGEVVPIDHRIALSEDGQLTQHNSNYRRQRNVVVNVHAVNQFMLSLNRMGRPSAVFALWDYMEVLWRVRPDTFSLNILLQTARWSVKYNGTFRGAIARFAAFREPDDEGAAPGESPRLHARRRMTLLLHQKKKYRPHSLWNGESAPRRALSIAVHMLLSNWPHLRKVRYPIPAASSGSIIGSLMGSKQGHKSDQEHVSPLLALVDGLPESDTYMQIMPADVTFRAVLDLLELNGLASEVPLVMAWMRKLQIEPSGLTFATALMYWSAVPDADRWGGRQVSYKALYTYLRHWRKGRMPRNRAWRHTFRRLNVFGECTRLDLTMRRIDRAKEAMQLAPPSKSVIVRLWPPHLRQHWPRDP